MAVEASTLTGSKLANLAPLELQEIRREGGTSEAAPGTGARSNSKHWFTTSLGEGAGKRCSECGHQAQVRGVWSPLTSFLAID